MPLTSHVDISATTRTPHLGSVDDLAKRITALKERAGVRAAEIDIAIVYTDPSIGELDRDVERHREAFAAYADVGVTWIVIPGPEAEFPSTLDFIRGCAERYLHD